MTKREYDDFIEFEILDFLNNNKDKTYTLDNLIKEIFAHHNQSMMYRIIGNMAAYIRQDSTYKITALGIQKLNYEKEIKEAGKREYKEKWKFYWAGFASSIITTIIAAMIGWLLKDKPKIYQDKCIEFPKVVIIHDKVYVPNKN